MHKESITHCLLRQQLAYVISNQVSHYSTIYFQGGRDVFPIWLAPRTMLGLFLRPAVAAPGPRLSVIAVLLLGGLFLLLPVSEPRGDVPGEWTGEGIRLTLRPYGAALCSFFRSLRTLMLMRLLSGTGAGDGVSVAPLLRAADDAVGSMSRDDTDARKLGNCFSSPRGAPGRRTGRPKPKPAMERFIGEPSCTDVLGDDGAPPPFKLLMEDLPRSIRFFFHSGIDSDIGDALGSWLDAEDGGRDGEGLAVVVGMGARASAGAGGGGAGASSLTVNGAGVEQTRSLLAGIGFTVSATSSQSAESSRTSMLLEVSLPC